jgi:hypothetical protein
MFIYFAFFLLLLPFVVFFLRKKMSEFLIVPSSDESMAMTRGLAHFASLFTPRQRPKAQELKTMVTFLGKQITLTNRMLEQLAERTVRNPEEGIALGCGMLSAQFLHLRDAYVDVTTHWKAFITTWGISDRAEIQGARDSLEKAMSEVHPLYREALLGILRGLARLLSIQLDEEEKKNHDQIAKLINAKCQSEVVLPDDVMTCLLDLISDEFKLVV